MTTMNVDANESDGEDIAVSGTRRVPEHKLSVSQDPSHAPRPGLQLTIGLNTASVISVDKER
jgi:hypothetical protein